MSSLEQSTAAKVCFVSTVSWSFKFHLGPHIEEVAKYCLVTLVADDVSSSNFNLFDSSVTLEEIPIVRRTSPIADLLTLFRFWMHFRRERFKCVHSLAPKAGLLAMLASAAAGVPFRFHTFTGQVWVTKKGIPRRFLMLMDWVIGRFATHLLADSLSQRKFLIDSKIVKAEKIEVLGIGSVVGVDTVRFSPDDATRVQVRLELGIGASDISFIYVGRLNRDKGLTDLLQAFEQVAELQPRVHLLLVGPDEHNYDKYLASLNVTLRQKIHRIEFALRPERYMAACDVFCFPSYREGFGTVLIEAAAVGLPAVASRIYGITDAVVEGETGILHEPGDVPGIVQAMVEMKQNRTLRLRLGAAARTRVIRDFSQGRLTSAFLDYYRRCGVF